MNYCPECGIALTAQSYQGRGEVLLCPAGHACYPPGPKILVAAFVNCGEKLLWMKRGNPPRAGHWAIPAGFMENGETLREAVSRELREETCVHIPPENFSPYMIGSISFISEVYIGLHASVDTTACACGEEALDVGFFREDEIDWAEVAYPSANDAVKTAYREARENRFGIYHGDFTDMIDRLDLVLPPPT
ncbi:NUDIX domain-containing protein [Litorivivens sp.]|uniref:NUDIX domain-containing protein n=2 Tax=Litorivivens sp. TaxID=2020868 RepID=UPI0035614AEE